MKLSQKVFDVRFLTFRVVKHHLRRRKYRLSDNCPTLMLVDLVLRMNTNENTNEFTQYFIVSLK